MGAIYGFTGGPDAKLLASLRRALAHRGPFDTTQSESPDGSCGYLARFDDAPRQQHGAGLLVDGGNMIALAGFLTGAAADGAYDSYHGRAASKVSRTATLGAPAQQMTLAAEPCKSCTSRSLLDAYQRGGLQFITDLQGDFVLAVHDGPRVHLVRDGSGARTIYYGRHGGRWLYGTEPKALWLAPGFSRRLRPAALAQYLTFSFVPGTGTMLEDIFELPAGHAVSLAPGSEPRLWRYFACEDEAEPYEHEHKQGPHKEHGAVESYWVQRFRQEFGRAVAERLPADQPVAVFLSGGLDSSVVTAEVARQAVQKVQTFALHFGAEYPHELPYAAAVAKRCGTEHEELLIRPRDFVPQLRRMIWHLDDPIGDPITMPNYILAQHVGRRTSWVFNGEGGDPCFGGPKNIPMLLHHWYGGLPRGEHFREQAYLASYRRGYEEISRLLAGDWRGQIDEHRDLEQLLKPFFEAPRPQRFLDKLALINIRLKGAHLILPKVERMLGAAGVVPLSPLFASKIVQLSFQMPSRLKLNGGVEKVILKRAYANQLPPEVIARPKSGMRVPVHYWFRGEMKRYARKILSPRQVRRAGIFDPQRVRQLLDYDIEEGAGRYGLRLWMLLTFEIWRRIVVEGEAP